MPPPRPGCRPWSSDLRKPAPAPAGRRRAGARQLHDAGRTARPIAASSTRPRTTSAPATSSRWCPATASARPSPHDPFALYRSLRRTNPSPFLFFLNFGDFQLAGSSPEILVRLRDGKITIRPIAGTRPRGATPEEDRGAGGRTAGRSQGAGRASDAARPRPQRRRPRGDAQGQGANEPASSTRAPGAGHRELHRRALQPRDAHRLQRRGRRRPRAWTPSTC